MQETKTWVRSLDQEYPLEWEWQPTPVFLPGEFHGQRSLVGYSPWGWKESDKLSTVAQQEEEEALGSLCAMWGRSKKAATCKLREAPLPGANQAGTLISGLPASHKMCLNRSACGILLWQPKLSKAHTKKQGAAVTNT